MFGVSASDILGLGLVFLALFLLVGFLWFFGLGGEDWLRFHVARLFPSTNGSFVRLFHEVFYVPEFEFVYGNGSRVVLP